MVEAEFVKFPSGYSISTGRPDVPTLCLYTFAVYISSHQLLIKTVDIKLLLHGKSLDLSLLDTPLHEKYEVIIGDETQRAYANLKQYGQQNTRYPEDVKSDKIDVSDTFIRWAKALHDVKNPPREVSGLLENIVE